MILGLTDSQFNLVLLASVPIVVRLFIMYLYTGTNPLQNNIYLLSLYLALSLAAVYVYYRMTA